MLGKAQVEMSLQATFSGKSHQMHRTLDDATSLDFGILETDASSTYCCAVRERTLSHLFEQVCVCVCVCGALAPAGLDYDSIGRPTSLV